MVSNSTTVYPVNSACVKMRGVIMLSLNKERILVARHARSQGLGVTNIQPSQDEHALPMHHSSSFNTVPFARVQASDGAHLQSEASGTSASRIGHSSVVSVNAAYRQTSYDTLPSGAIQAGGLRNKNRTQRKDHKHKSGCLARFLQIILGIVLLVLLVAAGYLFALNGRLSLDESERDAILSQLIDPRAGEPYYMLVLGSDSREGSGTSDKESESGDNERSDIMVLMRIDERNNVITMLSIPRDTPYRLDNDRVVRINEMYNIGGASESVKAISQLTGASISHYAEVHISDFEMLVDVLGGVDVDVPQEISVEDTLTGNSITVYPGYQTLSGKQAQAVVRARHEYEEGEVMRQRMVREVVTALTQSIIDRPLQELPSTVMQVASYISTDMNVFNLVSLASVFALNKQDLVIYSGTGPTAGDWRADLDGQWFCYDNPDGWAAVMEAVNAGSDPSTVDVNAYAIIP